MDKARLMRIVTLLSAALSLYFDILEVSLETSSTRFSITMATPLSRITPNPQLKPQTF